MRTKTPKKLSPIDQIHGNIGSGMSRSARALIGELCLAKSKAEQEKSRQEESFLHGDVPPGFRRSCCPECCLECFFSDETSIEYHSGRTWIDCKKFVYNVNAGYICDAFKKKKVDACQKE